MDINSNLMDDDLLEGCEISAISAMSHSLDMATGGLSNSIRRSRTVVLEEPVFFHN